MKALSLRQPWAYAVIVLGKPIENRRWNTSFRGTFLIHAAKGMTRAEYDSCVDFCEDALDRDLPDFPAPDALTRGGIVGIARLVDVIPPCVTPGQCSHRWHMTGQFGFALADVQALPFMPCRGSLGFFDVDYHAGTPTPERP